MSSKLIKSKIIKAFYDSLIENTNHNLKIITLLNSNGCNVVQTAAATDMNYIAGLNSSKASINIFSNKVKDIMSCNAFICEISKNTPSLFSLMFEALERKKPVLALYQDGSLPNEDWLSQKYDLLHLRKYNDENLEKIIKEFVEFARKKLPTSRFTIRLNDELCDYIDYLKAKFGCSSRNDVILKVVNDIRKDDYQYQEIKREKL